MYQKFLKNDFLILFSIIPLAILIGPAASLLNIVIIFLLGIFTLSKVYRNGQNFFSSQTVKLLILLYLYLIFNSFIAVDFAASAKRNFGFIRFIILFIVFNYFFYSYPKSKNIFKFWLIIFLVFTADVYLEAITGKNILGYGEDSRQRVVSFFKDELIAGAFINSFFLILLGYLFIDFDKKRKIVKILILILSLLFLFAIIFSGERSNSIKAFIAFIIFFSLNHYFRTKLKIYLFLIFSALTLFVYFNSEFLRLRYEGQLLNYITGKNNTTDITFTNNRYVSLYSVGYEVFKKHPLFGVGNKNFRVEVCSKNNNYKICSTHPHQIYFEFISEHGIVGTLILLSILFYLIFRLLKVVVISKNYIQLGSFLYLVLVFTPLLPGGAFFSDFNSNIFWINFSLLYASNKNTNIFNQEIKLS